MTIYIAISNNKLRMSDHGNLYNNYKNRNSIALINIQCSILYTSNKTKLNLDSKNNFESVTPNILSNEEILSFITIFLDAIASLDLGYKSN